ncbi:hypothetical protein ACSBR1_031735 [Camellia fascicularis]
MEVSSEASLRRSAPSFAKVPALLSIAKSDAIKVKKDDASTIRWRKGELIGCAAFGKALYGTQYRFWSSSSHQAVPALPPIAKSDAIKVKKDDAPLIRWRKGELIGCGAFGRVYMGLNIDSGALLAIKQVSIATNSASKEKTQAHIRELEEEVNLLKNLSHPNIVRYLGTTREEVSLNILLEIVPGGSISSLLGKFGSFLGSITIWVSSISFHAYAEITFQSTFDGGKGITDLKSALQNIFAKNIIEKKEDFLQTFSTECDYVKSIVSKGEILQQNTTNGHSSDSNSYLKTDCSNLEVIRVVVGTMPVGHLYSQLVPLVLIHVDGSNPIDITDPRWEILLIVQKKIDLQGGNQLRLLGFAAIYHFYHYPDSLRLWLSRTLVLPPYQHEGYGCHLLGVLNNVAICEKVYDLTIEEPLDSLQHVRTCIDVGRLLVFNPIQKALDSTILRLKQENLSKTSQTSCFGPPPSAIDDVRKSFKINKKQFRQCWEVLIYLGLDFVDKQIDNFMTVISDRVRADVMGKDSGLQRSG